MKIFATITFLAVSLVAAEAQSTAQGAASSAAPGEPEIVMPQVILQIEDLSVEKVVAQLPPENELLPPERSIPLLSEGDLEVGDPTIPAGVETDAAVAPSGDRLLSSEITLGAGLQNRILGTMSLKTLGADPRFALRFNHETVDGFSGHAPGSGFSLRNDLLDGSLKFGLGPIDTSLGVTFAENETGLQGLSPFVARLARSLAGTAEFSATPRDWLTVAAGADASTDTLTLEGGTPLQRTDLYVSPRLSAQLRFGAVSFGVHTSYSYRSDTGIAGPGLHRVFLSSSFDADLPATFLLAGDFGWFWNSDLLSVFPFSLSITGTPWQFLTMSLSGGYKVQPYDLRDILAAHRLAYPGALQDDRGWFGATSLQFTITRDLAASSSLSFMASDALPTGATSQDPATGLFIVSQAPGVHLATDVGLRWGISSAFSISAGWHHEFLDRPFFTPSDTFNAEIVGLDGAGRFGGSLSMSLAPTPAGVLEQPVLRLSGFWKASDAVKLQIDGDDLLWPLMNGMRSDIGPYATPGFRITGSLSMSL